jgi:hypothetical protein
MASIYIPLFDLDKLRDATQLLLQIFRADDSGFPMSARRRHSSIRSLDEDVRMDGDQVLCLIEAARQSLDVATAILERYAAQEMEAFSRFQSSSRNGQRKHSN